MGDESNVPGRAFSWLPEADEDLGLEVAVTHGVAATHRQVCLASPALQTVEQTRRGLYIEITVVKDHCRSRTAGNGIIKRSFHTPGANPQDDKVGWFGQSGDARVTGDTLHLGVVWIDRKQWPLQTAGPNHLDDAPLHRARLRRRTDHRHRAGIEHW